MTRRELEERCRKDMQQSIPDKDALWQRIEGQLPEQQTAPAPQITAKEASGIKVFRYALTAAACLLFVIAGFGVVGDRLQSVKELADNAPQEELLQEDFDSYMNEAPAEENEQQNDVHEGEQPQTQLLHYESLSFPPAESEVYVESLASLTGGGQLFGEEQVLADSECLVIGTIAGGTQNTEDGHMLYFFRTEQVYGDAAIETGETITVISNSPYLMQSGHQYLLGLRYDNNFWRTSCDNAPQPEFTTDGQAVYHNGWSAFRQAEEQPLVCKSFGADDYFYDRMYLGSADVLIRFAEQWGRV